ncbi:DNA polymerase catalytic subunit [Testudinid alphaherpesvirus 3]|uniref:DNA polymerase n=9 Tax=Herpesvirales TaxID=548681 RepID=A0A0K1R187_9ALPH|nr:DNA polymerase catalytic subunit [Testudinid alphaherpesvirus 3]AIU39265.1 DNA polymerase catalytic subunit [Testudinid alphaherpesvirus 3]AKV40702.1 UL30 DNA polymerase [Testudinid alphaherpesvirus 3]
MAVFINPYLRNDTRGKNPSSTFSYLTTVNEYKYIAPKSLITPGATGINYGTAERVPKCVVDDEELETLKWTDVPWPKRILTWGNDDHRPEGFEPAFSEFHVYDIVESTEDFDPHSGSSSRYSVLTYPSGTILTLLGISRCGKRVAVHVYGQCPYFYLDKEAAENYFNISTRDGLRMALAKHVRASGHWANKQATEQGFDVKEIRKQNIYYYDSNERDYYVIRVKNSHHMNYINESLPSIIPKFEGRVDATTRFLLDNENFKSFGWYRFNERARSQLRTADKHLTSADVEVNCVAEDLIPLPEVHDWPDYKLMCFDIECKAGGLNEFAFPEAGNAHDLVIQISCVLCSLATNQIEHKILFSLGSCHLTDDETLVVECDSEYELLLAFFTFLKQYSPEFITGYNINGFDLPYLITKAGTGYDIKLDGYGKFNKRGSFKVIDLAHNRFQKNTKIKLNGLVALDMYPIIKGKLNLSNYKLNTVCEEALGEKKNDLSYKDIPVYFAKGPRERGVIGEYCIQDSMLVVKLFFKYSPHIEMSEVAKLAHISINRVVTDGQQIRVFACLLKAAQRYGYILPDRKFGERVDEINEDIEEDSQDSVDSKSTNTSSSSNRRVIGYQGATVLNPDTGFYVDPVVVFDFASLYPSIIQAHNLCLSTLTRNVESLKNLTAGKDYVSFDVQGHTLYYVLHHVKQSLLGELLTDWLSLRKAIRLRMKTASAEEQLLLDKQQLAIKVTCNSVYGFTGVAMGLLPCLEVAATVTTVGRNMLLDTRDYIHKRWSEREKFLVDFPQMSQYVIREEPHSMRIIYGDTDSVFIKCTGLSITGWTEHGDAVAQHISEALFRKPIKLECEKTFTRLLMITKKKYIGLIGSEKMMMKGVDLVRKNNCVFVNRYAKRLVDCLFYNETVARAGAEIASVALGEWKSRPLPVGFNQFGNIIREAHREISRHDLNIEDFIMTSELSRAPENYVNSKIPHLTVYRKLRERNEQLPQIKDRIEYVMISEESIPAATVQYDCLDSELDTVHMPPPKPKKRLISDLAEDPQYVIKNNIPLNTEYYFTRLLSTVCVTFQALFHNDVRQTETCLRNFIPESATCSPALKRKIQQCGSFRLVEISGTPELTEPVEKIFRRMCRASCIR